MNIGDFVNIVKRQTQYGQLSNTTEQASSDIVNLINIYRKRIWRKWDWPWSLESISFAIAPGTIQYSVATAAGNNIARIKIMAVKDSSVTPPTYQLIKNISMERYYQWRANQSSIPDIPKEYFMQGLDANGKFVINLWPTPSSAGTIVGFGKKLLTTYALSDLVANTTFDYFPDGVIEDILLDGVMAGVFEIQGEKDKALQFMSSFKAKLNDMVNEELAQIDDDTELTSPPPDNFIWKQRQRGGSGVF